jgi:hypothetical protein
MLPDQIPKRLRDLALFLPEFDDNEGAWFKTDAVAVVESLKGTNVSISGVVILNMAPWGYAPSDLVLSVDRFPNEADTNYAGRSCSLALDFIHGSETVDGKTLFVLTFPFWKDAA